MVTDPQLPRYFDEILKATPEETEDVIVEPSGEWHSEDNRYASEGWKATHPPAGKDPTPLKRSPTPVKPSLKELNGKGKSGPSNAEIVILDSDDEDEGRVKRELSPSTDGTQRSSRPKTNGSYASIPPRSQTVESDIIDLTLDSDDEAPNPSSRKRRSDERDTQSPTEQIWKKSRMDNNPLSSGSLGGRSLPPISSPVYVPPPLASPEPPRIHFDRPYRAAPLAPPVYTPPVHPSLPPRPQVPTPNGRSYVTPATNPFTSRPGGSRTSSSSGWR